MNTIFDLFQRAHGSEPVALASAPGRVNLIGEHIDYNGGTVLPAALDRKVTVALDTADTPHMSIASTRFDSVHQRPLGDPKRGNWTDYAMGALSKAAELGWIKTGARLAVDSNLPDGAGVSSSAALITAILRASAKMVGVTPDPVDIALHARAVENTYIGMPCGIMDQIAVGLAEYGKAISLNTLDLSYETLTIPDEWRFLTLHTGIRRELSDGRYKARFDECQAAKDALKTADICSLSEPRQEAAQALPEPLNRRVRHTVSEHQRTLAACSALKIADIEGFAAQMRASHRSYSNDFEASLPEIDAMIAKAETLGAKAARLTGGGFGGCIVVLATAETADTWIGDFIDMYPKAWLI